MKVVTLYDQPGWALYNLGLLLKEELERRGHECVLASSREYAAQPVRCDVLYFSYSGLWIDGVDYRRHAGALACTVHDPKEISHFTDRLAWGAEPLRHLDLRRYDRIAVTSAEMLAAVARAYAWQAVPVYETPTFPHDRVAIEAATRSAAPHDDVRFFSATNAPAKEPWRRLARRAVELDAFVRESSGRMSLRQLPSLLIRANRKNIAQLERLRTAIAAMPGASSHFLHSRSSIPARDTYLAALTSSDVYVCTSFMEGGPLPVMEAVLAGLAVISTPVGQVERWVEDGVNGFICRTDADFRKAVAAYVSDRALLARHRAASCRMAARHAFDGEAWLRFVFGA